MSTKNIEYNEILIGWAEKDITPNRSVILFGQFYPRISEVVHDSITVTALVLTDKNEQAIMVSCDLCEIPPYILDRCREEIHKRIPEIDVSKVILNATHTHTAPSLLEGVYPPPPDYVMTPTEYADFFVSRVAEAVVEAWNNRAIGAVSWGFGHAVVGHNRRVVYFDDISLRPGYKSMDGGIIDGTSKMYGDTNDPNFSHIEGYEDHSVDMLFTWDPTGNLTGIIINLASPSQETEQERYISADFWSEIRTEVRKRYGERIFILAQCSSAGDQSPHLLLYKQAEDRMLKLRGLNMREEIGRRVANAVEDVLPYAQKDIQTTLPFKHMVKIINLKRRLVTEEELARIKEEYSRLEKWQTKDPIEESIRFVSMGRCKAIIERYEEQKGQKTLPMELHVIRLGDIAFATNGFELFLDYGLRIKARSPAIQTFIVQLGPGILATTNPYLTGSYLPTQRAIVGRGYSANVYDNEIGPEGGQELVEHTVKLLSEMWEDTKILD